MRGLHDRRVADRLVLSRETVRTHVKSILRKLGVHSQAEAIEMANGIRATYAAGHREPLASESAKTNTEAGGPRRGTDLPPGAPGRGVSNPERFPQALAKRASSAGRDSPAGWPAEQGGAVAGAQR